MNSSSVGSGVEAFFGRTNSAEMFVPSASLDQDLIVGGVAPAIVFGEKRLHQRTKAAVCIVGQIRPDQLHRFGLVDAVFGPLLIKRLLQSLPKFRRGGPEPRFDRVRVLIAEARHHVPERLREAVRE